MTEELAPGVRVPALAHTVGRLRPSVARELALTKHGLSLVSPEVRVFAPQPDGRAVTLWADLGRSVEAIRALVRGRRDGLRRVRPGRPRAGPVPRGPRGRGAARDPRAGLRRRAGRPAARASVPRPGQGRRPHDPARPRDGGRGLRRRVVRAPRPCARRSPGAASGTRAMGPWSAGTTAVLLADSAGNDGGAAGETVFAKGGPSRRRRRAGVRRAGGRGGDPHRRAGRGDHRDATAWRRASRWASGEEIAAPDDRRRHRPEAAARGSRRSGHARAVAALAGRQHPDAGDGREGQPRARRAARVPGRGRRRAAPPRPDPGRDDVDRRRRARLRRVEVRAARPRPRCSRRRSRRSSTRRWSPGRRTGRTS